MNSERGARIGLTRDFLTADGQLTYRDIGLAVLENAPRTEHEFFARHETCGCRHITTLPGVAFPDEPRRVSLERSCEELAWRVEESAKYELIFGVEAHIGSLVARPKLARELVEKVSGLTLTLDLTHFTRLGFPDSESEMLLPFASHFHLRGARKKRLQTSFKDNEIDYKSVLRKLQKLNYAGHIGIEYVWIDWEHCNEVDNISETVLFRDFVRAQQKARK